MKKAFSEVWHGLMVLVIIALIFGMGWVAHSFYNKDVIKYDSEKSENRLLKLPTEKKKITITKEKVEVKLKAIDELATYFGEYDIEITGNDARYLFDDLKIPFTTSTVSLKAKGEVKIGYSLSDIGIDVNEDKNIIMISLPNMPQTLENHVIWDSVQCSESNNIFNPISFEVYDQLLTRIEEKGLKKVKENDVYKEANKQLKTIIEALLSDYIEDGYTIMWFYQ